MSQVCVENISKMVAAVWMGPKCVVSVCHRVRNCFQHQSVSFQSALLMDMTLQVPASGDMDRSHFSSKGMDSSAKLRRHKGHLPCSAAETQVFQRQKQLGSNAVVFVNHIQGLGIFCFKIKNWRLTSRLHEILPSTAGHHYKQCKNTHTSSYIYIKAVFLQHHFHDHYLRHRFPEQTPKTPHRIDPIPSACHDVLIELRYVDTASLRKTCG